MPIAAEYFIGTVGGELVCHIAVCPSFHTGYYRATRLVVMPEWQGAGVGTKFLEWICEYHKVGNGRLGRKLPTMFHTSHPQLIGYLKRSKKWVLKSQQLYGNNKKASAKSLKKSVNKAAKKGAALLGGGSGFGGHFRAVQGYKYIGEKNGKA
jgi:GNAT superfamily N-acetyltransferase